MMFGLKFMEDVPFRAGLHHRHHSRRRTPEDVQVQGQRGRSAGNLRQVRNRCGSLRFRAHGSAWHGSRADGKQLEAYKFFATKIWNAARFMFQYVDESDRSADDRGVAAIRPVLLWIAGFLRGWLVPRRKSAYRMEQYHLHEAARTIYRFFWDEFCDWYLEMIKLHPERSKPTLLFVFESALRLLHPFMPFITEELWQSIPHEGESIVIAQYPELESP